MEVTVRVPSGADRVAVLGSSERNLKILREALGINISARDNRVHVRGEEEGVHVARRVLERLTASARSEGMPTRQQILDMIAEESAGSSSGITPAWDDEASWDGRLNVYSAGKPVKARTPNQEKYIAAIRDNDLVFAIGPAGTGKTYLAVAAAVHLLKAGRVRRVILTRPAVEAGEKLGFLPGDLRDKVNPYLRPLFDALNDMMEYSNLRRFMDSDVVEVVPLAFMRGRTLNNAIVILDEAQNTTRGQMKMFLTRMGQGSKMIVTGDVTQIDLPDPDESGLIDAVARLSKTNGVGFIGFEKSDIVRHDLVQRIIEAYGDDDDDKSPRRGSLRRRSASVSPRKTDKPQTDDPEASMEE